MVLIIPGPPVARQGEKIVARGGRAYRYPRPKCGAYLAQVRACWRESGLERLEGPVSMAVDACFPIPPSARPGERRRMASGRLPPQRRPDADGIAGLLIQALSGLAFRDGRQVVRLEVSKRYAPGAPEVRVELSPWTDPARGRGGERPWESPARTRWRP